MTETQAKSGVAGASARSEESPEETPERPEGSSSAEPSAAEVAADTAIEIDEPASPTTRVPVTGVAAGGLGDRDDDEGSAKAPAPVIGRVSVVPKPGTTTSGRASVTGGSTSSPAGAPATGRSARSAASVAMGAASRAGRAVAAGAAVGAAKVTDAARTARANMAAASNRGPRRARLNLKRIDPWSVMKFSFAVSLVLFVVAIVATSVLYLALDAMNVFDSINSAFAEVTGPTDGEQSMFRFTAKGVIGTSVLLGAVNMVLFTALATLGAFVYNVCADLVGGVELTLSEKE